MRSKGIIPNGSTSRRRSSLITTLAQKRGAKPSTTGGAPPIGPAASASSADAVDALDKVLEWLPRLPDDEERRHLKTDLLLQQERACETMGLRRRQQQIIGRLIAHLAPAGPSARLAETYLREGDLLTLLKRFNGADRALSTALRISRELDDSGLERNILRSVGLLRWHEGRNAEALALTESALAIDREREDDDAVAGDLVNLANILKSMGEYPVALSKVEEALAMPSLAQNPKKLAYTLHNLANVHRCMGDLDATLACLRRADEITGQLLPIQRSFHLTSIAHIELQQGSIEAAIHTYKDAIELSRRARHAQGLAHSLRTLGEVLFELGRHEEAVPYLGEAAELLGQLEDADGGGRGLELRSDRARARGMERSRLWRPGSASSHSAASSAMREVSSTRWKVSRERYARSMARPTRA